MCRSIRVWLAQQPSFVPLVFIPLHDEYLEMRFPGVGKLCPADELVVIADSGEIWRGVNAWIITLWALREYRTWSQRIATPLLKPFAKRICQGVSKNRLRISQWLFGSHAHVEAERLPEAGCENGQCEAIAARKAH
jgi:predicted DCC family thiol-disulfide oxidoreductase YuxK